jgi:hypothetical protein
MLGEVFGESLCKFHRMLKCWDEQNWRKGLKPCNVICNDYANPDLKVGASKAFLQTGSGFGFLEFSRTCQSLQT